MAARALASGNVDSLREAWCCLGLRGGSFLCSPHVHRTGCRTTHIVSTQAVHQAEVQQYVMREGGVAARAAGLQHRLEVCTLSLSSPVGALRGQPVWSRSWLSRGWAQGAQEASQAQDARIAELTRQVKEGLWTMFTLSGRSIRTRGGGAYVLLTPGLCGVHVVQVADLQVSAAGAGRAADNAQMQALVSLCWPSALVRLCCRCGVSLPGAWGMGTSSWGCQCMPCGDGEQRGPSTRGCSSCHLYAGTALSDVAGAWWRVCDRCATCPLSARPGCAGG